VIGRNNLLNIGNGVNEGHEKQLSWFGADFTHRELSVEERDFVKALSAMLDRVRYLQVAPSNTNLTAEGRDCLIVVIPHSLLAGLSIVVWHSMEMLSVSWAQISDLSTHDNLDLGHRVGRFVKKDPVEAWYRNAVRCVEVQLHRPIDLEVSCDGGSAEPYMEVFLPDADRKRFKLGTAEKRAPLSRRLLAVDRHSEHHVVRFTGGDPPIIQHPVNIASWYGYPHDSGD
jgi:hypothetical protein